MSEGGEKWMKVERTHRGFEWIENPAYAGEHEQRRVVSASSAIGDYENSWDQPGSSFLWIGDNHHFNREQVTELANRMLRWVETGSLALEGEEVAPYVEMEED